ncbi:MAG: glycosyltransferase family 39 protein, partial [Candidatus Eisenbacteria bacterium]|nr:glycosyltransferase family 39 protein [Candidatus Eisenbacteria bacterium]
MTKHPATDRPLRVRPVIAWFLAQIRDPLTAISLLYGLGWLILSSLIRPIGDYGVETDFYNDVVFTRQWMTGNPTIMNGFRGPFYHLLLGLLILPFRDPFLTGKVISVVSAAAGLRLAGGIVKRFFGPLPAVCAILFIAGNKTFIEHTFRACTDMLFFALLAGVFLLILQEGRRSLRNWVFAGAAAGVAWLTRYNGILLLPCAALVAFIALRPFPRAVKHFISFFAAWIIIIAPWCLFLWMKTGDPFWNRSYQNVAIGIYTANSSMAQVGRFISQLSFSSLLEVWQVDPAHFITVAVKNVYYHLRDDATLLVGIPFAAVAALGLIFNIRRLSQSRYLAYTLCGLLIFLGMSVIFYNSRFMIPLLLWWSLFAAAFIFVIASFLSGARRWGRLVAMTLAGSLGLVAILGNLAVVKESMDPMTSSFPAVSIKELAKKLKEGGVVINATTPIAARKPHIGSFFNAPVVPIPYGNIDDLRESGAHYLLISGPELNVTPQLKDLLLSTDPADVPDGLRLVKRVILSTRGGYSRVAAIFAIENPKPWTPKPPPSVTRPGEILPGMSRVDALRVQLAAWYQIWEPQREVAPLIGHLAPEAQKHPEALLVLGNAAFKKRDAKRAEVLYIQALAADP